jgi:tagatose-6-phosphate ketose/aldose isomerase
VLERALAERNGIAHFLVTCDADGRMSKAVRAREDCLSIVLDDTTNDRGLAMTSSFTNMVPAGQILARSGGILTQGRRAGVGVGTHRIQARLLRRIRIAGRCGARILTEAAGADGRQGSDDHAAHAPAAPWADGCAGPWDTLFVGLISSQPQRRRYELDLLREVGSKQLVRTRVAVATDPDSLEAHADFVLTPGTKEPIPDLCRPVLDVIFGQLLGLFASIQFGLKPDDPSPSGAISRVVQNVDIY